METKQPKDIVLCSIVKAELFYGALKSAKPLQNLEKLHKFLEPFVSLPFDDKASEIYGQIRANLEKSGKLIGPNDLLIAAITVANDVMLVTHAREFGRIDDLKLEDWELNT